MKSPMKFNLDASDTKTGRFVFARMPDGALGLVLTGQGAGISPAYAAIPSSVPSGAIIMWAGTIATIPSGYFICDGNHGTPNLLAKFVEGVATAATNPGATGGAVGKNTAGHIHSQPTHTHGPGGPMNGTPAGAFAGTGWLDAVPQICAPTNANGGDNTGGNTDSIADIRPPYYDLAFLMKS